MEESENISSVQINPRGKCGFPFEQIFLIVWIYQMYQLDMSSSYGLPRGDTIPGRDAASSRKYDTLQIIE